MCVCLLVWGPELIWEWDWQDQRDIKVRNSKCGLNSFNSNLCGPHYILRGPIRVEPELLQHWNTLQNLPTKLTNAPKWHHTVTNIHLNKAFILFLDKNVTLNKCGMFCQVMEDILLFSHDDQKCNATCRGNNTAWLSSVMRIYSCYFASPAE